MENKFVGFARLSKKGDILRLSFPQEVGGKVDKSSELQFYMLRSELSELLTSESKRPWVGIRAFKDHTFGG